MEDDAPSALVQEASSAERVVLLKVRVPGRTSFVVIGAARRGAAAGLLPIEERRALWGLGAGAGARLPPGSVRQRPREDALTGARVLAIAPAEVWIDQHGATRVLRVHGGRVVVTDGEVDPSAPSFVGASDAQRAEWKARGVRLAKDLADDAVDIYRAETVKALERARTRVARRCEAIRGDLGKIAQAETIASQAQWLVAEAARAPRGATKLIVTDWSSGEARELEVPLDPAKSARTQVEAMFKRAKRLKLGARIADERLAQAKKQEEAIALAILAVSEAATLPAIDEAAREAKKAAPRDVALAGTAPAAPGGKKDKLGGSRRTPFRTFHARSGRKLLVGKGAADNDALTQKNARPHDLWLHAKDRTGAHVIAPLDKGESCPADDLVDAAHLAAHFSDARDEKVVDVQYTQKRHLRKPKGSAPGFVIVDREKVLVLRVDDALLRALLEREEVAP